VPIAAGRGVDFSGDVSPCRSTSSGRADVWRATPRAHNRLLKFAARNRRALAGADGAAHSTLAANRDKDLLHFPIASAVSFPCRSGRAFRQSLRGRHRAGAQAQLVLRPGPAWRAFFEAATTRGSAWSSSVDSPSASDQATHWRAVSRRSQLRCIFDEDGLPTTSRLPTTHEDGSDTPHGLLLPYKPTRPIEAGLRPRGLARRGQGVQCIAGLIEIRRGPRQPELRRPAFLEELRTHDRAAARPPSRR